MKTKTIGTTWYFVEKYYTNEAGDLQCITTRWKNKSYAFKDCKRWREKYGKYEAHVFKAKQCIEVGD